MTTGHADCASGAAGSDPDHTPFEIKVLESVTDAVAAFDRDWRVTFANAAAKKYVGCDPVGSILWEVLPGLRGSEAEELLRRSAISGRSAQFEHCDAMNGRWTDVRAYPFADGLAVFVRDVSAKKERESRQAVRASEEVRQLGETLNERVRERTAELEAANQEMQGFTYSVSHDLRAPLRAIVSTSMMLLEESGSSLRPHDRELLQRQAAAAKKLGILIDELLKLSRLSRQELVFESVNLSLLAEDVAHELRLEGRAQDVDFEIEYGLTCNGDARLLRFVLLNLLENSCKFSPKGGVIRFGRKGGAFFVKDDGIGFDMTYAHKLFLPFERLVNDSDYPGTGIGLANVQRIIHRHGGRVWADSQPGKGATFYFTLGQDVHAGGPGLGLCSA